MSCLGMNLFIFRDHSNATLKNRNLNASNFWNEVSSVKRDAY